MADAIDANDANDESTTSAARPQAESGSRFTEVTRRAVLRQSMLAGGLALAPSLAAAACGGSDEEAFATATTAKQATTAATSDPVSSPDTAATDTSSSGDTFPDGAEMVLSFTFAAGSGGFGPVRNPYIAAWIEDTEGNLVQPLAAWYLQEQKGQRWLNELRQWYSIGGPQASTAVTGATRVAGDYSLTWDGTDLDGNPVPQGEYVVNVEAAREHGPYELVSGSMTFGAKAFSADLEPQGELTAASVDFRI